MKNREIAGIILDRTWNVTVEKRIVFDSPVMKRVLGPLSDEDVIKKLVRTNREKAGHGYFGEFIRFEIRH